MFEEKHVGKVRADVNILILNLLKNLRVWYEVFDKLIICLLEDVAYFQDCAMKRRIIRPEVRSAEVQDPFRRCVDVVKVLSFFTALEAARYKSLMMIQDAEYGDIRRIVRLRMS